MANCLGLLEGLNLNRRVVRRILKDLGTFETALKYNQIRWISTASPKDREELHRISKGSSKRC